MMTINSTYCVINSADIFLEEHYTTYVHIFAE